MSGGEIVLIIIAALLLFGAKGLPDIARTLGRTLREVKKATDDIKREIGQETSVFDEVRSIRNEVKGMGQNVARSIMADSPPTLDPSSGSVSGIAVKVQEPDPYLGVQEPQEEVAPLYPEPPEKQNHEAIHTEVLSNKKR
jgi:sec-independent protein translocase protein TatA